MINIAIVWTKHGLKQTFSHRKLPILYQSDKMWVNTFWCRVSIFPLQLHLLHDNDAIRERNFPFVKVGVDDSIKKLKILLYTMDIIAKITILTIINYQWFNYIISNSGKFRKVNIINFGFQTVMQLKCGFIFDMVLVYQKVNWFYPVLSHTNIQVKSFEIHVIYKIQVF